MRTAFSLCWADGISFGKVPPRSCRRDRDVVGSLDAGLHNIWAAQCMETCKHSVDYVVTDNERALDVAYMACMCSALIDMGKLSCMNYDLAGMQRAVVH